MSRWGQKKALSDWQTWWQSGQSMNAKRLRVMEPRTVNERVFVSVAEMFNQLFFLGSLPAANSGYDGGLRVT